MPFSFKDWYEKNGVDLNKSRRDKYRDDPEYREKILQSNREVRKKKRKERDHERKEEQKAVRVRPAPTPWKSISLEIETRDGKEEVRLFTVGALAHSLGKSVQTVRLWEKHGVIPETEIRGLGGNRLYTAEQVEVICEVLRKQGRLQDGIRRRRDPPSMIRVVRFSDGTHEMMRLFRISVLARALGRELVTIEQMERRGFFPETPLRASKTLYRLYTVGMIRVARRVLAACSGSVRGEDEGRSFYRAVKDGWNELGILNATLLAPERKEKNGRQERSRRC